MPDVWCSNAASTQYLADSIWKETVQYRIPLHTHTYKPYIKLLDLTSEHSTAIWDQQGRPVEGIIVPKSGHATAYVKRFVQMILRKLGPFALRIDEKHSLWCISLSV